MDDPNMPVISGKEFLKRLNEKYPFKKSMMENPELDDEDWLIIEKRMVMSKEIRSKYNVNYEE